MDIKSWILLIGTLLIVAVICHGFWTAYQARKNDVRMEIESDIPEDDLDEMVLLRGELPNGGARVTPTVGFEALRMKDPQVTADGSAQDLATDDAFGELPLDEVVAFAEEGVFEADPDQESTPVDEGNVDAGYEPEQTSLDLTLDEQGGGLEERYAQRIAAARQAIDTTAGADEKAATTAVLSSAAGGKRAPLLVDAANTPLGGRTADAPSPLPRKKLIAPEDQPPPRKQFEPPYPEELAAQERAQERAQEEVHAAAEREKARLAEKARIAEVAAAQAAKAEQERIAAEQARQKQRLEQQREEAERKERDQRVRAAARKTLETPEQPQLALAQTGPKEDSDARRAEPQATMGGDELVVLNVIAKTSAFHGGDVLELFLRNGIKFGDMNIFHRIDPVTKASQYSIASLTEPGYFDLRTMDSQQIKGLCLFMQLPGPAQPTKVFTDMLTVADKLARQLDAEVCDEQFNRLTRQSTEHYRQRVAEFTRRQMAQRALV